MESKDMMSSITGIPNARRPCPLNSRVPDDVNQRPNALAHTPMNWRENMPTRLEQIVQKASALPVHVQEEIADQLLKDIDNELKWQQTLEKPQPALMAMAEKALQASIAGKTHLMGFDEIGTD